MALFVWRGDARGRAQVCKIIGENIEADDVVTLTINRKDISFTALSSSPVPVYEALVAAIEEADVPELADITAEVVSDASPPYLQLTGASDGRPFVVTTDASNGSLGVVTIATTTSSFAGANEKQLVTLPSGVAGGTFTLTFSGQTTSGIAYNATPATVQAALVALSNIDSGDVAVSGASGGPWTVEFKQAYAATDVALMTINTSSLTAGAVSVVETAKGSDGSNEIVRVTMLRSASTPPGTPLEYGLKFPNASTVMFQDKDFSDLDTAAKFRAAIPFYPSDITVTLVSSSTNSRVYDLEFINALGHTNWSYVSFYEDTGYGSGSGTATIQDGNSTGVNETQTVSLSGAPTGGTFTLTYSGQTTSGIAYNAAAAAVESALEALSNIGSGDVAVTGTAPVWEVVFQGALAATDVVLMTGNGASLTGGSGTIDVTQTSVAPVNEVQQVSLLSSVSGGTFTLTYVDQTTSALSFVASAATIEAALEALSNVDAVSVAGEEGGPWAVEFQGSLAATNVTTMIGDGDSLTGDDSQTLTITTTTEPTGPHHWNEPANWDQNSVPVTGSDVRIENSESGILYGLGQSAVTLLSLDVRASFTGDIGLPDLNPAGFYEYLPDHLAIGATTVRIGEGEGGGSSLIRLDTGTVQTDLTVWETGSPSSSSGYAVEWIGTHEDNAMTVYKGTVGVATGAGEAAVLATLDVSFVSSRASDSLVYLGDGVTVGAITKDGGELTIAGRSGVDVASLQSTAGDVYLRGTDGIESLTLEGGDFYYWSTGTLGGDAVVSGDGQLIFDGDKRPKTVTNAINIYGDSANVIDSAEVVNADGLLSLHYQGTTRFADLGSNIIISRGTPAEGAEEVSITLYAAAMQMVSVAVDDTLETIAAMLTTASYVHPTVASVVKTDADIIQIDIVAPTADITLHDATNDTDGQLIATDGVEYVPVSGAAATAFRLVTDTTADVLLKIYYS